MRTNETIFSDISLAFNAHPVTGNVGIVKNEDSIKQSIKNIILTNFYEKPYNPIFGGHIIARLFENITSITQHMIETDVKVALRNYEPRAQIINVRVTAPDDRNTINITIVFKPVNSLELETVDVILERVR